MPGMITIFTPSFADEGNTNAQNITAKEVVARLDPDWASVTMFHEGAVDSRIATRRNTTVLAWHRSGNSLRTALHLLHRVPDIYFFPREGPLDAIFLKMRRNLRLKTAVISYIVSGGLDAGVYSPARMRNIREADIVVANNSYLSQLLRKECALTAGTIYDGVDRRFYFPPQDLRKSRALVTVLYAGSFRPWKRVPLVVREAARWPQVRFRVAGRGEEEQKCKDLARELQLRNVDLLGHVTQAQLGEEMRSADIFFFPSILEGHPQVLLQALASGLPVIAMKTYHPDSVIDGVNGFLAESDSGLSEKLSLLIGNPELRAAMGEAATRNAQRFDWDAVAREWQRTFENALQRKTADRVA